MECLNQLASEEKPTQATYKETAKTIERYDETGGQEATKPQLSEAKQKIAIVVRPLYISIREYQEAGAEEQEGTWDLVREKAKTTLKRLRKCDMKREVAA